MQGASKLGCKILSIIIVNFLQNIGVETLVSLNYGTKVPTPKSFVRGLV